MAETEERWTAEDDARLDGEARWLLAGGDPAGAVAVLADRGLLFARHAPGSLPCLCKKCLVPEAGEAEHGGVRFVRDFVVRQRRVLFYWMPAELAPDAKRVRASMRAALEDRLRRPDPEVTEPREVLNPFTKQMVTLPPRVPRLRVNPFTGKPVP